ncbi:MAG TPA: hypothetical protein VFC74_04100 [Oscillospiraceae bacterium]|nr:hypothetical protein [Oscillospiraceae bacterium]
MTKYVMSIATVLLIFTLCTAVFANSGPVYWQGYPAAEMMSIATDTPLTVESEELVFDFSQKHTSSYALEGKVTATYQMSNPTSEQQAVQMAFPFVGQLRQLNLAEIVIKADAQQLPYELYLGSRAEFNSRVSATDVVPSFAFTNILSALSRQQYSAAHFSAEEIGRLYRFDVSPTTEQNINFVVTFNDNAENTKILINGFNGFAREAGKVRLSAWCSEPQQFEVFALGEELEFTMQAYTNGELSEKTDLYTAQVTTQEQQVKLYLVSLSQHHLNTEAAALLDDTQVYNLYAEELDQQFTQNLGVCALEELWALAEQERIMVLLYSLEFPPQRAQEISVSYKTSGTMDKRETVSPQYSFTYLLNPAAHWSEFKDLQIKIITSPEAPYLINSSLPLKQTADRQYSADFTGLPGQDLTFTLFAAEKVTLADKVAGRVNRTFGYITPISLGILLLLIILFGKKRTNSYF